MPTLFCCILNCDTESSNLNTKRRKIFYRFPQNNDRKQLWLSQIGGENRIKYGAISGNSRICNAHFATGKPNLDSNHIDYAPTLFPWSSIDDRHKIFEAVEQYELKIKELEQKILAKAFLSVSKDAASSTETPRSNQITELRPSQNQVQSSISVTNLTNNINYSHSNITKTNQIAQNPQILTPKLMNNVDSNNNNNNNSSTNINNNTTLNLTSANVLQYILNSLTSVTNLSSNTSVNSNTDHNSNIKNVGNLTKLSIPSPPFKTNQNINNCVAVNPFVDPPEKMIQIKAEQITDSKLLLPPNTNNSPLNLSSTQTSASGNKTIVEQDITDNNDHLVSINGTIETKVTTEDNQSALNTTRSCTCTKSGCLKLYCECFSGGNVCGDTCSCNNCKNNGNHAEERAKIINLYLERDPSVFNSKIENREVGKKHSKGCNCLKSSCLKNYCECFENKVLCSNLCRCRRCFNTDRSIKDESSKGGGADSSVNGSETMSMTSVNSPQTIQSSSSTNHSKSKKVSRKRRAPKSIDVYEDVSSIESDADTVKQSHIDVETVSPSNSLLVNQCNQENQSISNELVIIHDDHQNSSLPVNVSGKSTKYSVTSNHGNGSSISTTNPPSNQSSLPREQDYTEEELALMQKLRKQRKSTDPKSIKAVSLPPQPAAIVTENANSAPAANNVSYYQPSTTTVNPTLPTNSSPASSYFNNNQFSSTVDILQLLVAQQLLSSPINKNILTSNSTNPVPSQFVVSNPPKTESTDCLAPPNCSSLPQQLSPVIIQHHNIHTSTPLIKSPNAIPANSSLASLPSLGNKDLSSSTSSVTASNTKSLHKISAEDYVRKHIEAAERAVRADNLRKETLTSYTGTNTNTTNLSPTTGVPANPPIPTPGLSPRQKQPPFKHKVKVELTLPPSKIKQNTMSLLQNKTPTKTIPPIPPRPPISSADNQSILVTPTQPTSTKPSQRSQMKREIKSIKSEIGNIKLRMLLDKSRVKTLERSLYKLESDLNRKFKNKTKS